MSQRNSQVEQVLEILEDAVRQGGQIVSPDPFGKGTAADGSAIFTPHSVDSNSLPAHHHTTSTPGTVRGDTDLEPLAERDTASLFFRSTKPGNGMIMVHSKKGFYNR